MCLVGGLSLGVTGSLPKRAAVSAELTVLTNQGAKLAQARFPASWPGLSQCLSRQSPHPPSHAGSQGERRRTQCCQVRDGAA